MNINQYRAVDMYVTVQLAALQLYESAENLSDEAFEAVLGHLNYANEVCMDACEAAFGKRGGDERRRKEQP